MKIKLVFSKGSLNKRVTHTFTQSKQTEQNDENQGVVFSFILHILFLKI
jgi:hypothetical protein